MLLLDFGAKNSIFLFHQMFHANVSFTFFIAIILCYINKDNVP